MLTSDQRKQKQKQVNDILFSLSDRLLTVDEIDPYAQTLLVDIYDGEFRHYYADFFPLLVAISQKHEEKEWEECLTNNLGAIQSIAESLYFEEPELFEQTLHALDKLCDHVSLEIARLQANTVALKEYANIHSQTIALSQKVDQDLDDAVVRLDKASKKAASMQTEVVAVLSIFSAIVIAFFGGMGYISSALSSMGDVSIYATVLVCCVCGVVLINTIFLLLYIVGKITERNIYARCQSPDCSCGENSEPKCTPIERIKKRLPYVFYINVVLLGFIFIDLGLWFFDYYNIPSIFLPQIMERSIH